MTPIEASIWHAGVAAQSYLAHEIFGSNVFLSIIILALSVILIRNIWAIGQGQNADEVGRRIIAHLLLVGLGLLFLRTINGSPFSPVDPSGKSWVGRRAVISSPAYQNLKNSTDGLYWYTMLHKGSQQVSKLLTSAVNGIFSDPTFPKSPNILFKTLVNTATVALDDSKVTTALDTLAQKCSDTVNGTILDKSDSLKALFDLSDPECQNLYRELNQSLETWVGRRYPRYLTKIEGLSQKSAQLKKIDNHQALKNKVTASAIINYARSKSGRKDGINTNATALQIRGKEEHFWFNVQRVVSNGASAATIANFFTGNDAEAAIIKNEAGIIYNNLLNLVPPIRGYIKATIALAFIFCAAALALGMFKPMIWWLSMVALDSLYTPLSTLNYQISSLFLMNSDVLSSFGDLRNDPLVLAGASLIDGQLVRVQTAYFLMQIVIIAFFVFGVLKAGFTVRQMSFAQGSGFTGFVSSAINSRAFFAGGRMMRQGGMWAHRRWQRWRGIRK